MSRWPTYLGRTLILLLWLFFISLPLFAFVLAARQEIAFGGQRNHVRVFLLQDKEAEGIGIQITRPVAGSSSCTRTNVNYSMWVGEAENVSYCLCEDPETQQQLPAPCPP